MTISILFKRFQVLHQNAHEALDIIIHQNGVQIQIINTPHHSPHSAVGEPQSGGPNVEDLGDWILDASEIEFCKVSPWAVNLELGLSSGTGISPKHSISSTLQDERGKVIKLGEGGFGVVFKVLERSWRRDPYVLWRWTPFARTDLPQPTHH